MDSYINRSYKKCVICGVRRIPKSQIFLASFPLEPERCRLWVKASGDEDLIDVPIEKLHQIKFICGLHFTRDCFNEKGNRLLKHAVPTLALPSPLADDLFTEFPLHVKSYYEKNEELNTGPLVDKTNTTTEAVRKISLKSVLQNRNKENITKVKDSPMFTKADEHTSAVCELIPVASTSKAPMHSTFKRNCNASGPVNADKASTSAVEYTPVASTSKAPMCLTFKRQCDAPIPFNTDDSSTCAVEYTPVASTSIAPKTLTYKRKSDAVTNKEFIEVQSYKRQKSSDKHDADQHMTKREKKLLKRLEDSRVTIKRLSKTSVNLDKIDSETLKTIVENAIKNQNRECHGKRWDLKNKISALAIFKRSPKAYRYMQNMLPLPSVRTLQRILKNIPVEPGVHAQIIDLLKKRGEKLHINEKYCVLLFDEMALKKRLIYNESSDKIEGFVDLGGEIGRQNKIAGHALVFMLQGLKIKFKQPIGHYFVEGTIESEKLSILIRSMVESIKEAGFTIIATVCDQGPTNIGALNFFKRGSNLPVDENYFYINKNKVFIIYDVPHLFKSIRNIFFQAGTMQFNGKIAKWCHLIEAEKRNKSFLNFPKITQTVVNPTFKIKMRVKYAAHALSNTMKAVLKSMAVGWDRERAVELLQTADIIEELDKLFDATNGPASPNDRKPGIRENVLKKTKHIEWWNYYLKNIDTMKFFKSDSKLQLKNIRCIKGYKITLKSLKDIWLFLSKEADYKYLNLRQLNQDALENLFGTIRQHGITNRNPTCSHFNAALKSSIVSGLTGPHSRGSNCLEDANKVFVTYRDILKPRQSILEDLLEQSSDSVSHPVLSIPDETDIERIENDLTSFEEQATVYVSGYLAAKIIKKIICIECEKSLVEKDPDPTDPTYTYISLKEWWPDKKLKYPKKEMCVMVMQAKEIYEKHIVPDIHHINICQWCSLQLSAKIDMSWYKCAAHTEVVKEFLFAFISKLFVRKTCKIINDSFSSSENDIADKTKKAQQANKDK